MGATAAGCSGPQSALAPAGADADAIADLFLIMISAAGLIWLAVIGTTVYAIRNAPIAGSERMGQRLILLGGVVLPTILLAGLLSIGLTMLPGARDGRATLTVDVLGEEWWWRVAYEDPATGSRIAVANEVHLPVDRTAEFVLTTADVIHSFWIPSLGGKMDMIPGRTNRLQLTPTKPGIYRGVCAEFCGAAHALMAFTVVVETAEEFEAWLRRQAEDGAAPTNGLARRGRDLFLSSGCSACHVIRGVAERGSVGPDLTHVGGRRTLAAGTLPNTPEHMARWLADTHRVKPEVGMPDYGMLSDEERQAIAAYLAGLQ